MSEIFKPASETVFFTNSIDLSISTFNNPSNLAR